MSASRRAKSLGVLAVAVVLAMIVVVVVVVTRSSSPGRAPGSLHRPVADLPVDPGSAAMVSSFVDEYHRAYGSVGVTAGMPMLTVPASQPRVSVAVTPGCNDFRGDVGTVPLPARAASLVGSSGDSPIVVWQPSTDTDWELWQAHHGADGQWSACWGGRLPDYGSSTGVFPHPFGVAASGVSFLSTEVTFQDIEKGSIDHVMGVDVPSCRQPPVAPADRTDCGGGSPIAEGTRFRLPADLAMPAGLTPFARMVFTALQRYGMVVIDRAGAVQLQAEFTDDWAWTGHTGTDPITASWAGKAEYQTIANIPWSKLQAVSPAS